MTNVSIWARDLDGTGSMHPCAKGDPGAVEFIRADLVDLLVEALRDWLAYAEENLSEFDLEPCSSEKLCYRCQSAGCINLKIRNSRAALPLPPAQEG